MHIFWARDLDGGDLYDPDPTWALAVYPSLWIILSERAWNLAPEADRWDTIAHEIAHLIAWRRHGIEIRDHGREWRRIFARLHTLWDEV